MKSFICTVVNGKIPVSVSHQIREIFARQPSGRKVEITLREWHPSRSKKQNAYYWGCCVPAIKEEFNSYGNNMIDDEVHEFLKQHVAKSLFIRRVQMCDGTYETIIRSSKNLTTKEWEEFMELVRAWASEQGIHISLPNEHIYD